VVRGVACHISKFLEVREKDVEARDMVDLTILNCNERKVQFSCDLNMHETVFLADLGASVHACIATCVREENKRVGVIYGANGSSMKVQAVENRVYKTESGMRFELQNLNVIESLKKNIISIGALLDDDWKLDNTEDKNTISLTKTGSCLVFHDRDDGNLFSL
jgi:hypothetical protein